MTKERADVLVFKQGLAKSRELAKRYIMAGKIYVDKVRVDKAGEFFSTDTIFKLRGQEQKYVSRGGYKLEKALDSFKISLKDAICCDFGASTGGFTDCMLQRGAKKVYSIDVGYGQLDYSLRVDPRVQVIEKTNIRYLDPTIIRDKIEFISIDVSFISLELILPKAFEIIKKEGKIVSLIKPQFEAGKNEVGKGGIVRNKNIHTKVINKISNFVKGSDYVITDLCSSPIRGSYGNMEYLILIEDKGEFINTNLIEDVVMYDI